MYYGTMLMSPLMVMAKQGLPDSAVGAPLHSPAVRSAVLEHPPPSFPGWNTLGLVGVLPPSDGKQEGWTFCVVSSLPAKTRMEDDQPMPTQSMQQ